MLARALHHSALAASDLGALSLLRLLHSTALNHFPQVVVPPLGESVSEGTISALLKKAGDKVNVDEVLAQLETDKVTIDCKSQYAGSVSEIMVKVGDVVKPGAVLGIVGEGAAAATPPPAPATGTAAPAPAAPASSTTASSGEGHRQPLIHFPLRVLPDGRRLSELPEAEADAALAALQKPAAAPAAAPAAPAAAAPPPPPPASHSRAQEAGQPAPASTSKNAPTSVTRLQVAPPRRRLTQAEMDMINGGGVM